MFHFVRKFTLLSKQLRVYLFFFLFWAFFIASCTHSISFLSKKLFKGKKRTLFGFCFSKTELLPLWSRSSLCKWKSCKIISHLFTFEDFLSFISFLFISISLFISIYLFYLFFFFFFCRSFLTLQTSTLHYAFIWKSHSCNFPRVERH